MQTCDILVIGGGINGAGIARDAAGRGLRVLLCEKGDLAGATSSSSTKLIHGGLRYLEYYEFRLVREALKERERLLRIAPHIVWPLRFVLPHTEGLRPRWLLRAGLFLYDHLARLKRLPGSEAVALPGSVYGAPLRPGIEAGFLYSDCWVEDSRLVVLNAMDAAARGAGVRTRCEVVAARRVAGRWHATIRDADGIDAEVVARIVVNAAGPWVVATLGGTLGIAAKEKVRLVKGSHIVTRRLYEGEHAYIFQNPDKRIVFAIPYERDFTLIGTTDVPHEAAPGPVTISPEETAYLCESVDRFLKRRVTPDDVVWSYSGLRPLFDDAAKNASAVTRDYVLDVHAPRTAPPRCCRCSAARSPPTAASPSTRWRSSRPTCRRAWRRPGRPTRRCPAATCPTPISRCGPPGSRAGRRSCRPTSRIGWHATTARGRWRSWAPPPASPTSARISARG